MMASCVVAASSIKVFCRCLQTLSKISEELFLEPTQQGLSVRAVNCDQSVFVCFNFLPDFFAEFSPFTEQQTAASSSSSSQEDLWIFRIPTKCMAMIFRSHTTEKSVEVCKIFFDVEEKQVRFVLQCRHDVFKTYNLSIMESEKLDALFAKNDCANSAVISSRILLETCNNFQLNTEEICMNVSKSEVVVRNYIHSEPERNKVVKTEVVLTSAEFDQYQINLDVQVSFCMKEFKAFLALADSLDFPVSLYFDRPGRPFICSVESEPDLTIDCLLATLADGEDMTGRAISSPELHQVNLPASLKQSQIACGSTQPFPSQIITNGHNQGRSLGGAERTFGKVPSELCGGAANTEAGEDSLATINEVDEEAEVLPATPPPAKRFRSRFLNLSQATLCASQLQVDSKVLVEDSDTESKESN